MKLRKIMLAGGLFLVLAMASLLVWTSWPAQIRQQSIDLPTQDFLVTTNSGSSARAIQARLTLEWPATVVLGESQTIRIQIMPVHSTQINRQPPNNHIVAEARLDLAGVTSRPEGSIQQPWPDGQSLTFYWTITSDAAGFYEGNVWFTLIFVQPDGSIAGRNLISDQTINLQATNFLGFSIRTVRFASLVFLMAGCLIFTVGLTRKSQKMKDPSKV